MTALDKLDHAVIKLEQEIRDGGATVEKDSWYCTYAFKGFSPRGECNLEKLFHVETDSGGIRTTSAANMLERLILERLVSASLNK